MYEDFYIDSPSYFDEQIDEFKEALRKSIKEEFLKEMERLSKENEELQEVKNNFNKIKLDYQRKEEEFKLKEQDIMKILARKKIEELTTIADMKSEAYWLDTASGYIPKCDKCDDERLIHFKSPSGKDCTEPCPNCGTSYYMYFVKPVDAVKIRFTNEPCIKSELYYIKHDYFGGDTTYSSKNIFNGNPDEFDYEHFHPYGVAFTSKELAQKICNELNKRKGIPDNAKIKEKKNG